MRVAIGVLLLVTAVSSVILQVRYATQHVERHDVRRIYLLTSGFVLGFLAVVFFAYGHEITGDVLVVACLVGFFASISFGWLAPKKMRRIYKKRTLINPDIKQ